MHSIPAAGLSATHISEQMQNARKRDLPWRSGKVWAYVYPPGPELEAIQKRAFTEFITENGLDPTAFPSLLKFENDVVSMCVSHLRGDAEVVGNMTTGGTESCMLAVKTARDYARKVRGIQSPEIILPVTAHAAFFKAAQYFDVKVVVVPVDPETFKVSAADIKAVMNSNTALIVVSAPSYAQGVIDPVTEVAALALSSGVLCHVDGCIGAFLLPFFRELGAPVPDFDFQVPGVTSISMDLHKYAFCPKGASVLLWKNKALRKHQIFACASWIGYSIVNPTMLSTKSGGPIAAAWATLHAVGHEGYLTRARSMLGATRTIVAGIRAIPGLKVLGEPEMSLVAFTGIGLSVFHVADEMNDRGWYVQPQLSHGEYPESIHLSLVPTSAEHAEAFLKDLAVCTDLVRGKAFGPMVAQIGAMAAQIDASMLTDDMLGPLLASAGIDPQALPGHMADVNALMNVLSPDVKEIVLKSFINDMFRQPTE